MLGVQSGGMGFGFDVGSFTQSENGRTLTFGSPVKAFIQTGEFYFGNAYKKGVAVWVNGEGYAYASSSVSTGTNSATTIAYSPTTDGNTITIPSAFSRSGNTYKYIAFF